MKQSSEISREIGLGKEQSVVNAQHESDVVRKNVQLNRPSSSQTRWLWKLLGILDTCGESVDSLMDRLILKHFIWIYRHS